MNKSTKIRIVLIYLIFITTFNAFSQIDLETKFDEISQDRFVIHGKSMEPIFYDGDVVRIIPKSSYVAGDIVAYQLGDVQVVHQIAYTNMDEDGWYAVMQGVNNDCPDGIFCLKESYAFTYNIRQNQILGRVA